MRNGLWKWINKCDENIRRVPIVFEKRWEPGFGIRGERISGFFAGIAVNGPVTATRGSWRCVGKRPR